MKTHSEKIKEGIAKAKKTREQIDELNVLLKIFNINKTATYSAKSSSIRTWHKRWQDKHRFRLYSGLFWTEPEYFQSFAELKERVNDLISQRNML